MSDAATSAITVSSLTIYPVKSLRGVSLTEAEVADTGLAGDRVWQLVDPDGRPRTQRNDPVMATIDATPVSGGLRLSKDGAGAVEVEWPDNASTDAFGLLGDPVSVGDGGDEAAAWLTDVIGAPTRLVANSGGFERRLGIIPQPISFVDAGPVLLANRASYEALASEAKEPFPIERFRANIVVTGATPWAEDSWQAMSLGGARLQTLIECPRCAMPQIDQLTGERHKEPAVVLKSRRWCPEAPHLDDAIRGVVEGNALFGNYCGIGPAGSMVRLGDTLVVESTRTPTLTPS